MIKAIVFDFDGVLADSEPLHLRAYQEVLAPLGITLTREEYYSRYLGYDDEGVFTQAGRGARDRSWTSDGCDALIAERARVFDAVIEAGRRPLSGRSRVHRSDGARNFRWVSRRARCGTRSRRSSAARRLDSHFRFIVASGDTPASKPAPDPYRRAAELHGIRPVECLAIEDSRWGIESAKAAGLRVRRRSPHTYPAGSASHRRRRGSSSRSTEFTPALVERSRLEPG